MNIPSRIGSIALGIVTLGMLLPAGAQTYTWTSINSGDPTAPGSGNWSDGGAWSGHTLVAGATAQLDFGGSDATAYTATNNLAGVTINGITLDSTASVAETVGLGGLTFGGTNPFITQLGSGAFTLSGNAVLGAATTLGGTGTGLVNLSGILSGAGGVDITGGAYQLSGNNTFTGGVSLGGGVLEIGSTGTLGASAGVLTITGGEVSAVSTTGANVLNALKLGGAFALGDAVNTGAVNLQGAIQMIDNVAITVNGTQTMQMRGLWTDTGGYGLTVEGTGSLELFGSIAALGSILVDGGNLILLQANNSPAFQGVLTVDGGSLTTGASGASGQLGAAATSHSQVIVENGGTWIASSGNAQSQYVGQLTIGSATDTSSSQLLMGSSVSTFVTNVFVTGMGATGPVFTLQGSAAAPAILNLGGTAEGQPNLGSLTFDNATGGETVLFGPNGRIVAQGSTGTGGGFNTTYAFILDTPGSPGISTNPFTYVFDGTTIDGSTFSLGSKLAPTTSPRTAADVIDIRASLGDGTGTIRSVYAGTLLDWTGAADLGATIVAQTLSSSAMPWIRVAPTVTEMMGGTVVSAGANTATLYAGNTALTFDLGGTSFKLDSAAVLDVRDATAAQGVVTQNNTDLVIDGALRGNSLADDTAVSSGTAGNVTIESGGELALASDGGTYTVSATGAGANNRTIYDEAGGTFSLGGGAGAINMASATGLDASGRAGNGGAFAGWNGGIVNADGSHTIADTAGILGNASLWPGQVYVLGAGGGLNGFSIAETSLFPTSGTLILNAGSSLLVKDTTAAAAGAANASQYVYTILPSSSSGFTGAGPLIVAPDSGGFTFGINQANPAVAGAVSTSTPVAVHGNTAVVTLNNAPSTYNLTVGGLLSLGSSGNNSGLFTGQFVITAINGNAVTIQLYGSPTGALPTFGNIVQDSVISLRRDKGADNISLVDNVTGGVVSIDTAQTGSGNLYVNANEIALNSNFSGTGGIYSGTVVQGSGWTNGGGITGTGTGAFGAVDGAAGTSTLLSVAAALGTSASDHVTISLNAFQDGNPNGVGSALILQSTASLAGTQDWTLGGYLAPGNVSNNLSPLLVNQIVDPTRWAASVVNLTINGASQSTYGTIEAATSTADPAHPADYKFGVLTLAPWSGGSGYLELVNNVENDLSGGVRDTGKEAFYATALNATSGSLLLFDLNGQDLYLSQFAPTATAFTSSGRLVLQNDAVNSISDIRAIDVLGQSLNAGSFRVTQNATLEVVDGNWNSVQWGAIVAGAIPADTSAAPNVGVSGQTDARTTLLFGGTNGAVTANVGYLGSGTATGGNAGTSDGGTANNGTFRVVNGSFTASNYILNPVGAVGTIDTTTTYAGSALPGAPAGNAPIGGTTSGIADNTYDTVTIRANSSYSVTAVDVVANTLTLNTSATAAPWKVGDQIVLSGLAANAAAAPVYYIVGIVGSGATTRVQISTTPGGPAIALNATWFGGTTLMSDPGGAEAAGANAALVVAGTTNVIGNLDIAPVTGAVNQATLRVGGNTPGTTLTAASATGTGILNVLGNFTVGAAGATNQANLAVQGNGVVNVGGNVAVYGAGVAQGNNVTGFVNGSATGVGFDALSNFTLDGNTLGATPSYAGNPANGAAQTVSLASGVSFGKFHVGDGSAGVLTPNGSGGGFAAQAQLQSNVAVATSADINGAASRLDLNGHTLTVAGGAGVLTNGGILLGTGGGMVAATVKLTGAGASILAPGSGTLSMAAFNAVSGGGLSFTLGANTAAGTLGSLFLGTATTLGTALTFDFSGPAAAGTTYDLLSFLTAGSDFSSSRLQLSAVMLAQGWSVQSWSFLTGTGAGGADTTLEVSFASTPEPSTVGLGLLGLSALALGLRRRLAA